MKNTAEKLRGILSYVLPLFREISDSDASHTPGAGKWSKKEILGHLIDSACNNQQKFVRTMEQSAVVFPGYSQGHWVKSQSYNSAGWIEMVDFWNSFNFHLAHIIENAGAEVLSNRITIDDSGPFTLEFIMKDYLEHLMHHLRQILPDADIENSFEKTYNV